MGKGRSVFYKLRRFSQQPTQPSLFHYIRDASPGKPFVWKEFFRDILTGARCPSFIPSILDGSGGVLVDRNQLRTRRIESAAASILAHASVLLIAILLLRHGIQSMPPVEGPKNVVNIAFPFLDLPDKDNQPSKGRLNGGGGGMREQALPKYGWMPTATRDRWLPPDPGEPQPRLPEDTMTAIASVVMPFEKVWDGILPIGDHTAPISNSTSGGPGGPNGIGTGTRGGIGPGNWQGYGLDKDGIPSGGVKSNVPDKKSGLVYKPDYKGLKHPEALVSPKPEYTDEARRARTEGTVILQAVIMKNGLADNIQVIRSLGYGLDASAIQTILTKWRFKPGQLNGVPVDSQINIEIYFKIY